MTESPASLKAIKFDSKRLLLTSIVRPVESAIMPIALTGPEAAEFTKLSAKTLERHAEAGEPVGRVKIGRRVVYLKAALESWLASKVQTVATSSTH